MSDDDLLGHLQARNKLDLNGRMAQVKQHLKFKKEIRPIGFQILPTRTRDGRATDDGQIPKPWLLTVK